RPARGASTGSRAATTTPTGGSTATSCINVPRRPSAASTRCDRPRLNPGFNPTRIIMSRSYRISVRECVNKVIKAEDKISTTLEILEVLPPEQMSGLLADQLEKEGYRRDGNTLVKEEDGVVISVDAETGEVTISSQASESTKVEGERVGRAYDDVGPHAGQVRENLRQELQRDLEKKVGDRTQELQGKVTDKLEGKLGDLRQELDKVVNKVTAEALKRKAASMGQVKEIKEDEQTGSLSIVVEV